MKKPNGYGSIYKMSGKRRKPFRVVITIGYDVDDGRQLRKTVGYFENRKEAEKYLATYEYSPEKLKNEKLKILDIYEMWSKSHFDKITTNTVRVYNSVKPKLEKLNTVPFADLKVLHIQDFFDNSDFNYGTKKLVKSTLKSLYGYAQKYEIISNNFIELIDIGKKTTVINRKIFTNEEIEKLWRNKDIELVDTILILIYTGLRISELLQIKKENVDIENRYISGIGVKTEAGKNRLIPLNKKIIPFFENRIKNNNDFLFTYKYGKYRLDFIKLMEKLEMLHTIHDTRHTFATLLNNADVNKTSITKLIGHSKFSTTENIYTHKDITELKKAIDVL